MFCLPFLLHWKTQKNDHILRFPLLSQEWWKGEAIQQSQLLRSGKSNLCIEYTVDIIVEFKGH